MDYKEKYRQEVEKIRERREKILIVDDSEMNRMILSEILKNDFEIIEAGDAASALKILEEQRAEITLMLLDIVMPGNDGFSVLEEMNVNGWIEEIPVMMISAEKTRVHIEKAYEMGVTDYISRPFDAVVVHRRVVNAIKLYARQEKLVNLVIDQLYQREKESSLMIQILSHIVEFRNGESGAHVYHINLITEMLAHSLMHKTDKYGLGYREISVLRKASSLHDIGKIGIPESILNKPGKLTAEEFEVMKKHPLLGAELLDALSLDYEDSLVRMAYEVCRWHHERYDGKGYPDGLAGDEIPISAQIVSVADVYDALTSERVYKKAFSHEEAMKMIRNGECGCFHPLLMECLEEISDQLKIEMGKRKVQSERPLEIHDIAEELLSHEELAVSKVVLKQLEKEKSRGV